MNKEEFKEKGSKMVTVRVVNFNISTAHFPDIDEEVMVNTDELPSTIARLIEDHDIENDENLGIVILKE